MPVSTSEMHGEHTPAPRLDWGVLIDTLSAEHRELLPQLARVSETVAASPASLKADFGRIAPLLGQPLDEHIANEERELFPAYATAGGDTAILSFFAEEHREILSLRNRLVAAIEDGEFAAVRSLAEQLDDLLSAHTGREDEVLFPMMREHLCGHSAQSAED